MTYIASVLSREGGEWTGTDLDLAAVDDLDALADRLRDPDPDCALCFLEEDDEYLAIVRVDGDGDPRVFVSDRRVLDGDGVAGRLLADSVVALDPEARAAAVVLDPVDTEDDEDGTDEEDSGRPEVEPAGDQGLLDDLGVPASRLVELCAEEGMLPSDVIFAVAEALGIAEVLEAVRGV